jgi:hypothetical protein
MLRYGACVHGQLPIRLRTSHAIGRLQATVPYHAEDSPISRRSFFRRCGEYATDCSASLDRHYFIVIIGPGAVGPAMFRGVCVKDLMTGLALKAVSLISVAAGLFLSVQAKSLTQYDEQNSRRRED